MSPKTMCRYRRRGPTDRLGVLSQLLPFFLLVASPKTNNDRSNALLHTDRSIRSPLQNNEVSEGHFYMDASIIIPSTAGMRIARAGISWGVVRPVTRAGRGKGKRLARDPAASIRRMHRRDSGPCMPAACSLAHQFSIKSAEAHAASSRVDPHDSVVSPRRYLP